jgi:hypothetical protein
MPIIPIIDPEPRRGDLKLDASLPEAMRRPMAEIVWKFDLRKKDPNAFLVPFASDVPNYPLYLKSPLWKALRKKVLKEAGHACAACTAKATQVHHRDYRPRVLAGDDLSALLPLCKDCHGRVHADETGKKRISWNESERVLTEMVAAKEALQCSCLTNAVAAPVGSLTFPHHREAPTGKA